jgi:transcription antitermination factor NusG
LLNLKINPSLNENQYDKINYIIYDIASKLIPKASSIKLTHGKLFNGYILNRIGYNEEIRNLIQTLLNSTHEFKGNCLSISFDLMKNCCKVYLIDEEGKSILLCEKIQDVLYHHKESM